MLAHVKVENTRGEVEELRNYHIAEESAGTGIQELTLGLGAFITCFFSPHFSVPYLLFKLWEGNSRSLSVTEC